MKFAVILHRRTGTLIVEPEQEGLMILGLTINCWSLLSEFSVKKVLPPEIAPLAIPLTVMVSNGPSSTVRWFVHLTVNGWQVSESGAVCHASGVLSSGTPCKATDLHRLITLVPITA